MYEQIELSEYIYGISFEQGEFMMNRFHEVQYNEVCLGCRNECKQSFRCQIVECPRYRAKRQGRRKAVAAAAI